MTDDQFAFTIYKQYLVQLASLEGRPFSLPKTNVTMLERSDSHFFYALTKKLKDKAITNTKQITVFMETARKTETDFHISDVVKNFQVIWDKYKLIKEDTTKETKNKIKKAFEFLTEYCIINDINRYEDLLKGSPPVLLKLWKRGSVDERVLISLFDFDKIKRKPWYRVYCGDLVPRIGRISKQIGNNVELSSFIEGELVKFKEIFLVNSNK